MKIENLEKLQESLRYLKDVRERLRIYNIYRQEAEEDKGGFSLTQNNNHILRFSNKEILSF